MEPQVEGSGKKEIVLGTPGTNCLTCGSESSKLTRTGGGTRKFICGNCGAVHVFKGTNETPSPSENSNIRTVGKKTYIWSLTGGKVRRSSDRERGGREYRATGGWMHI